MSFWSLTKFAKEEKMLWKQIVQDTHTSNIYDIKISPNAKYRKTKVLYLQKIKVFMCTYVCKVETRFSLEILSASCWLQFLNFTFNFYLQYIPLALVNNRVNGHFLCHQTKHMDESQIFTSQRREKFKKFSQRFWSTRHFFYTFSMIARVKERTERSKTATKPMHNVIGSRLMPEQD